LSGGKGPWTEALESTEHCWSGGKWPRVPWHGAAAREGNNWSAGLGT